MPMSSGYCFSLWQNSPGLEIARSWCLHSLPCREIHLLHFCCHYHWWAPLLLLGCVRNLLIIRQCCAKHCVVAIWDQICSKGVCNRCDDRAPIGIWQWYVVSSPCHRKIWNLYNPSVPLTPYKCHQSETPLQEYEPQQGQCLEGWHCHVGVMGGVVSMEDFLRKFFYNSVYQVRKTLAWVWFSFLTSNLWGWDLSHKPTIALYHSL